MNKKISRILGVIFLISLICCLIISAGCKEEEPEPSETFTKWAVTVDEVIDLGEEYKLDKTAISDNDKSYPVDVKVIKNSDNSVVEVVFNSFVIRDIGGYKIVYTVNNSSKEEKRIVNISVKDNVEPNIIISDFEVFVGEKTKLPQITVNDLGDSNPTHNIKIYNKETNEEVVITNEEFMISDKGEYVIEVTAQDKSGNSKTENKDFYVRNRPLDNEILNPDCKGVLSQLDCTKFSAGAKCAGYEFCNGDDDDADYSKSYIRFFDNRTPEQLQDEISLNDGGYGGDLWISLGVYPRASKENLMNYKYIRAWVYYEYENYTGEKEVNYFSFDGNNSQERTIQANKWQLIELNMDSLLDLYDDNGFVCSFFDCEGMQLKDGSLRGIRIGEVYGYNYADLDFEKNTDTFYMGDTINVGFINPYNVEVEIKVLDENDDTVQHTFNDGIISFKADRIGSYKISAKSLDEEITNENNEDYTISIGVNGPYYITIEEYSKTSVAGDEITLPKATLYNAKTGEIVDETITSEAKFIYFADKLEEDIDISNEIFTPSASGKIEIEFSHEKSLTQKVEITINQKTYSDNVLLDTSSKDALLSNWSIGNGGQIIPAFVAATENEDSYLELTFSDSTSIDWHQFYFKPYKDRDSYKSFKYIKMETMLVTETNTITWLASFGYGIQGETNKWYSFYVPIDFYLKSCKGQNGAVELDTLKIKDSNYGTITGIRLRNIEAVNEAPELEDDYSLLDVSNNNIAKDIFIADADDGSYTETTRNIKYSSVESNGTESAYLKIDFTDAIAEDEWAYWTNVCLNLNGRLFYPEYEYFSVTIRYTAENTVKKDEDGFGGIEIFRVSQENTTTNEWYTVVFSKSEILDSIRNGVFHLSTAKTMGTIDASGHGHITSIDIAEVTGHKTNPNV